MEEKCLVIAYIYMDENNYFELDIYENVEELIYSKNVLTGEKLLACVYEGGKQIVIDYCDIEWYKYVSKTSHLAQYVCSKGKGDYEWDDEGNVLSNEK
ncbi:hypothetical protein [Enterococcus faecalis]|uniref:hypothetical protein n=1 Tax=Enterococcus faecalis TaxID=1351 RepID=UPI00045A4BF2|nr:hypothetical protein [Enterococcus faecalis]KAJ85630.1 hypothetical protein P791_1229 [Enterococcus faecalis NY9]